MELVSRDRIAKRTLTNASNSGLVAANVAHVSTHAVPTGEKNLHFVMPTIAQNNLSTISVANAVSTVFVDATVI